MNTPDLGRTSPPPLPAASPLDESHFRQIRQASLARRAARSAGRLARSSGVVTLAIGVLGLLLTAISFSLIGLVVSIGVCIVGAVELRGSGSMRRAEPSAARVLGANQLAFMGLIIVYCVVQMATFSLKQAHEAVLSPETSAQLSALPSMQRSINGMVDEWAPRLTYGFYGLIILLSMCFQGGMAAYYFTRRKHVLAFDLQTPEWIRRLFVEMDA